MTRDRTTRGGFTLIEILVVLSVLAALIVVMSPVLFSTKAQGERAATHADLQGLKAALQNRLTDPKVGPRRGSSRPTI